MIVLNISIIIGLTTDVPYREQFMCHAPVVVLKVVVAEVLYQYCCQDCDLSLGNLCKRRRSNNNDNN